MNGEISMWRLNLLRVMYLLLSIGLAVYVWPGILMRGVQLTHMGGVVSAMLMALSLLSLLGLHYPLKLLPLLLFEALWKLLWYALVFLPAWRQGKLTEGLLSTATDNCGVILIIVVLPWGYLWREYVKPHATPWRISKSADESS